MDKDLILQRSKPCSSEEGLHPENENYNSIYPIDLCDD